MPHDILLPEHLFLNLRPSEPTLAAPTATHASGPLPSETPIQAEARAVVPPLAPELVPVSALVPESAPAPEQPVLKEEAPAERPNGFAALGLSGPVLAAVQAAGYDEPTPIQTNMIPHVLAGRDVLGQAQTGTGKTAAFALPLLSRLEPASQRPQILVLAPTRELALQVSDSFQRYGTGLRDLRVTAIYGGQSYGPQLRDLKRGAQIVIGTPGRVMDHMRRGSLDLSELKALVLDEADEMLNMGFAEDVEWILAQTPASRQTALFSATMPPEIRRLAQQYLNQPVEISLAAKTTTADTIRQRYWIVRGLTKPQALIRLLESEETEGVLVFVRTREATLEVAQRLENAGYKATALNGDLPQAQREQTVERLRRGKLDVLVATDVAARGLDVERISHVINYDIPFDPESYTHRIGRTGRAGRSGEAILLVEPKEQRLLSMIEKATRHPMTRMYMPDAESLNQKRIERFLSRITHTRTLPQRTFFQELLQRYAQEQAVGFDEIAAALALLVQGKTPLLLPPDPAGLQADPDLPQKIRKDRFSREKRPQSDSELGLAAYRVEIGRIHGLRPGMLVGAIANEAGIDSQLIGKIKMHDTYTVIDLPQSMEKHFFKALAKTRVQNLLLRISRVGGKPSYADAPPPRSWESTKKFSSAPKGRLDHAPRAKAGKRGFLGK